MCGRKPGSEKQMADRHVVASGEEDRQYDNNIMRDIQVGKRGWETAIEEQPDGMRKAVRFEQEATNTSSSSTVHVSLDILRVVRDKTKCWIRIEMKMPEIPGKVN